MQRFEVERRFAAPRERVWEVYTDWVGWSRWAGLGRVRLDPPGRDQTNGVGCVRVIQNPGLAVREEIVCFEPPERLSYRVVGGPVPMRDHLGEVFFAEDGGGTRVTWRCRFESTIPGLGGVSAFVARTAFGRALAGLARELGT